MTAKAADLCLATDVAADLGVPSDDRIQRAVSAASKVIAKWCGRTFERASGIVEYPIGACRPLLILERPPIVSIDSITELGATVTSTDYESVGVNADAGLVLHKSRGWYDTNRYAPGTVSNTLEGANGQSDMIVATYTGGYVTPGQNLLDSITYPTVTLPDDVIEAAIQTAVALYKLRGLDDRVELEAIGDWQIRYYERKEDAIPAVARALLGGYRRGWVL